MRILERTEKTDENGTHVRIRTPWWIDTIVIFAFYLVFKLLFEVITRW